MVDPLIRATQQSTPVTPDMVFQWQVALEAGLAIIEVPYKLIESYKINSVIGRWATSMLLKYPCGAGTQQGSPIAVDPQTAHMRVQVLSLLDEVQQVIARGSELGRSAEQYVRQGRGLVIDLERVKCLAYDPAVDDALRRMRVQVQTLKVHIQDCQRLVREPDAIDKYEDCVRARWKLLEPAVFCDISALCDAPGRGEEEELHQLSTEQQHMLENVRGKLTRVLDTPVVASMSGQVESASVVAEWKSRIQDDVIERVWEELAPACLALGSLGPLSLDPSHACGAARTFFRLCDLAASIPGELSMEYERAKHMKVTPVACAQKLLGITTHALRDSRAQWLRARSRDMVPGSFPLPPLYRTQTLLSQSIGLLGHESPTIAGLSIWLRDCHMRRTALSEFFDRSISAPVSLEPWNLRFVDLMCAICPHRLVELMQMVALQSQVDAHFRQVTAESPLFDSSCFETTLPEWASESLREAQSWPSSQVFDSQMFTSLLDPGDADELPELVLSAARKLSSKLLQPSTPAVFGSIRDCIPLSIAANGLGVSILCVGITHVLRKVLKRQSDLTLNISEFRNA